MQIIDSSAQTPVVDTNYQALLLKHLPTGDTVWTESFGDPMYAESITDILTAPSGGYMAIVRQPYTSGPGSDFTIQQIGSVGELGTACFINIDQWDNAYDLIQCSDGNYIAAGRQASMHSRSEAYVLKTDPAGSIIWERTCFNAATHLQGERILELPDSTLVVAGIENPADGTGYDLLVIKLSADGDSLYSKIVPMDGYLSVKDIAPTGDGGYKILVFQEYLPYAFAVVRMDSLGEVTSTQYNFRSTTFVIKDAEFTPDGGAILAGGADLGAGQYSGLLIELAPDGTVAWEREFEDADASILFESVIDYADGGYVLAGKRKLLLDGTEACLLVRTDEDGTVDGSP